MASEVENAGLNNIYMWPDPHTEPQVLIEPTSGDEAGFENVNPVPSPIDPANDPAPFPLLTNPNNLLVPPIDETSRWASMIEPVPQSLPPDPGLEESWNELMAKFQESADSDDLEVQMNLFDQLLDIAVQRRHIDDCVENINQSKKLLEELEKKSDELHTDNLKYRSTYSSYLNESEFDPQWLA